MVCNIFLNLGDDKKMPALGLGTWQSTDSEALEKALDVALEVGYRHIDTAEVYENEEIIGRVLKRWFDSGKLKRQDVFITTKLAPESLYPEKVEECLKESLRKLQLDYVDLYLTHFPVTVDFVKGPDFNVHYVDVWKKIEEQYDSGRAKNIGISNFNKRQVEHLLKNCRIKPINNQIELHVYLQQKELVDFCQRNGITVVAYSPLGSRGYNIFLRELHQTPRIIRDLIMDETVIKISKKHSKTPAQILLRFLLQTGVAPIPKSVTPSRIEENFNVFDFSLDGEDMENLRGLEVGSEARTSDWKIYPKLDKHPEYPF